MVLHRGRFPLLEELSYHAFPFPQLSRILLSYGMIRLEVMLGLALFYGAEFHNIRNVISPFHQSVKTKRSQTAVGSGSKSIHESYVV
jgi:hypothetical protein